jgi:CubicO group peptidase (beta-lactamase class C family)
MANLEHDVPNTPRTKFRLGSITKQFAAMAIMQLEQKGKLKVDDAACKYLPSCPPAWEKITIHHLLTHTSGIPNVTAFPEYRKTWMLLPTTPVKTMSYVQEKPLDFPPGEKYRYSNSGYVVLAAIVEKASGTEWEPYLRTNIFSPVGMNDTGHDTHRAILKHRATGYARDGSRLVNSDYHDMSMPIGGGDLYSTVEDLLKWDQALYTEKLLTAPALARMFTPFKNNYAYGWATDTQFNRKRIAHGGGINGFSTFFARYPDDKVTVAVLANMETAASGEIARSLAAIVFGEKYDLPKRRTAIKLDPKIYDAYVGKYEVRPGFIVSVTRDGDRLMAQATNQSPGEIFPESETDFFLAGVDIQITFVKGSDGKVDQLILHQSGRSMPAKRVQ